jgi:hypothetical protein
MAQSPTSAIDPQGLRLRDGESILDVFLICRDFPSRWISSQREIALVLEI